MNITFTGTENHAAACMIEAVDANQLYLTNNLTCTLNNEGKKDLDKFKDFLNEFTNSKKHTNENSIVISVKNRLSKPEIGELINNHESFFKKYNPSGDMVYINGIPVGQGKNKVFIMKNLQELVNDIQKIQDIKLLLPAKKNNKEEIMLNLFKSSDIDPKILAESLTPSNIKMHSRIIFDSISNTIKRIR